MNQRSIKSNINLEVDRLPKIELHIHLEGAIRPKTYEEFKRRSDPSFNLSSLPWLRNDYRFCGLNHFLNSTFGYNRGAYGTPPLFNDPEDYERIAHELFEDLANHNVRYAEVSLSTDLFPFDEILDAIDRAKRTIMGEKPIKIGLIIGLLRTLPPKTAADTAMKAADGKTQGIVGIDLYGQEDASPSSTFIEAFDIARQAGLGLRVHAGEGLGAESIWDAVHSLQVSRIGHGIRAMEDLALIRYLQTNPIALDICPTSNYKIGIVPSLNSHPIRRLFDLGIRVTVSSDDPLYFNTNISDEYRVLTNCLNFSYDELNRIALNAVDASFLSENDKANLRREIAGESA